MSETVIKLLFWPRLRVSVEATENVCSKCYQWKSICGISAQMSNVLHSLWSNNSSTLRSSSHWHLPSHIDRNVKNVNMFHWRKHHLQLNYITWGRRAGGIQRSQNTFRALCGGPFFLELQCLGEACREFEGKKYKIGKGTLKSQRMRPFEATACWRCQAASAGRRPGRAHHGSLAPLWVFEPSGTFQSWSMLCYVFSIFFLSYHLLPFKSFLPIFSIYFLSNNWFPLSIWGVLPSTRHRPSGDPLWGMLKISAKGDPRVKRRRRKWCPGQSHQIHTGFRLEAPGAGHSWAIVRQCSTILKRVGYTLDSLDLKSWQILAISQ